MSGENYAKFKNDRDVPEIKTGVREVKCAGASAPQDYPHIYLDMGTDETILCPYWATLFRYDEHLGPGEADPPDSLFLDARET